MSDLPERTGHRQMRVSDADRDQVAEVLREATSQGRITFDELEERLGQVYAAKTYADLDEVTHDLPGPGVRAPAATATSSGAFPAERLGGTPGSKTAIAVMSGAERKGAWVVPPTFVAFAMMGGIELDLREARFSEREVMIQAYTFLGGISITVGEDVEVDVSGIGFMGAFEHGASGPGVPGAPRVRINGFAFMGGVDIKRKPRKGAGKRLKNKDRPEITD
ncbi:MAG TPA: DUF1707 domain-containing protein [Streptosporangiaceae bacterium]